MPGRESNPYGGSDDHCSGISPSNPAQLVRRESLSAPDTAPAQRQRANAREEHCHRQKAPPADGGRGRCGARTYAPPSRQIASQLGTGANGIATDGLDAEAGRTLRRGRTRAALGHRRVGRCGGWRVGGRVRGRVGRGERRRADGLTPLDAVQRVLAIRAAAGSETAACRTCRTTNFSTERRARYIGGCVTISSRTEPASIHAGDAAASDAPRLDAKRDAALRLRGATCRQGEQCEARRDCRDSAHPTSYRPRHRSPGAWTAKTGGAFLSPRRGVCKGTGRTAPPPAGAAAYCGFANPSSARIPSDVSGSQRLTPRRRSANAATPISSAAATAIARGASAGAGEIPAHVPRCPGRSQRPNASLQAVLQQTPSTQKPVGGN